MGAQAGVMRALMQAEIPVPRLMWSEADSAILGAPFLIMEYVPGDIPSDSAPGFHGHGIYFDATEVERAAMWRAGVEHLAALHRLDWRSLDLPNLPGTADDIRGTIAGHIELLESWVQWGSMENISVIQRGIRWLKETPAPVSTTTFLWGDARPGNIIHREGNPVALLDWELASIGLPAFDLFYWWWSSEVLAEVNHIPRLRGLPDRDSTIAIYERAFGQSIKDSAEYAETYALLRLVIMGVLGVRASVSEVYTEDYLVENGVMRALSARL